MNSRTPYHLAILAAIGVAGALGWNLLSHFQNSSGPVLPSEIPVLRPAADIPDARKAGDEADTMRRLHALHDRLRAEGWNALRVPREMTILPDARFAESKAERENGGVAFPSIPGVETDPSFAPVAFYTKIYARYNRSYYKGDRSVSRPTGYVIVDWKDGRIDKVPLEKVRVHQSSGGLIEIFPGMAGYDTAKTDPLLADAQPSL